MSVHARRLVLMLSALLGVLVLAQGAAARDDGPLIVADIAPVGALLRDLTGPAARVHVLIPQGAPAHEYALKPSDMLLLRQADLVVWLGPRGMPNLARAVAGLPANRRPIALMDVAGTVLWPRRNPGLFAEPGPVKPLERPSAVVDPHAWLDPENGRIWARHLAPVLAGLDPALAKVIPGRLTRLDDAISRTENRLTERFSRRNPPFVQFHDAFQYFERRFGLTALGAATIDSDLPPAAGVMLRLRRALGQAGPACLFVRDAAMLRHAEALAEPSGLRPGFLDPLAVPDGTTPRYPALIAAVGDGFSACFNSLR